MTASSPIPEPVITESAVWQDIGIVDLNAQGEGVGRHDGQVIFVPFTIPGEIIDAQIVNRRPSFSRGAINTLRLPSPTRVAATCEHFTTCGGCQYQHIAYPAQPEIAAASVIGNLRKLLKGWTLPEPQLISSPEGYGYRTQARLQFRRESGALRMPGYIDLDGHVMLIAHCPILHPALQRLVAAMLPMLAAPGVQAQLQRLDMRYLTLQSNAAGTECALLFQTFELLNLKKHLDKELWGELWEQLQSQVPEFAGLVIDNGQSDIGFGQNYTTETNSHAAHIPLGAFKQNNARIEATMYELVERWLDVQPQESGIDAYCGRGELTARLAELASTGHVTGIESAPTWFGEGEHINTSELPASLSGRVRFVQHTVEQWLIGQPTPDWLVCNPPRKGMESEVISWLQAKGPRRWIYISCNPATFARDVAPLADTYTMTRLACLDMFPQTAKMELVALLERNA